MATELEAGQQTGAVVAQGGTPSGSAGQTGPAGPWQTGWSPPGQVPVSAPAVPPGLEGLSQVDLYTAAQKGLQADHVLAEAAKDQKANAVARQFQDDMTLLTSTGDPAAYRRAAAAMNIPGDQVEAGLQKVAKAEAEAATQAAGGGQPTAGPGPETPVDLQRKLDMIQGLIEKRQVSVENLSPELQGVIGEWQDRQIGETIQKAIDSDDALRYHMEVSDASGQEAIRDMVWNECERHLRDHTTDGVFGDGKAALKTAIPAVRTTLGALRSGRTIPPMGVGSGPAGGGDTFALPSNTPPQRVGINAAGFDDYVSDVLEHNLRRLAAEGGGEGAG